MSTVSLSMRSSEELSPRRQFMYISCIDSGSICAANENQSCPYHVIGGPIIPSGKYMVLESALTSILRRAVPEDQWGSFEFHASDMFRARGPFESMGLEKCRKALEAIFKVVNRLKIPILYGAVDGRSPELRVYPPADPTDAAFRLYLQSLEEWFLISILRNEAAPGILIVDELTDPRKKQVLQKALDGFRRKHRPDGMGPGLTNHLLDAIYFGDSKNSIGIQLADICMYFTARHLGEKPDSEGFYRLIESRFFNLKPFHVIDD